MNKRFCNFLVIFTMLIFTISTFAGCAGASVSSTSANNQSDMFQNKDYFVVGFDDTFVPMGFKDEKGEIVGFDVDLAKEVFNRLGKEVRFQPIDWAMKETELNSGNIDLIWNGYTITEERKNKVAFTKPYLANRQIIITLAASSINSKADLTGKAVALQNGSSSLDAVNAEPGFVASLLDGEPVLFDTNNEALIDLEAGRSDAVVADEILARYYIKQRGEEKYRILEEDFGSEEYGIGIRKTDTELLEKVDSALDAMRNDGTYFEIYEKWFGENGAK